MIRRLAALILLNTLSLLQTAEGPAQVSWTVLELGDNLTLSCTILQNESGLFYWYKLKFGYLLETVAAGTLNKIQLQERFNKSRFSVTKRNAQYFLDIRNVSKEDEATYFCQAGSAYIMKFINGTHLAVNDFKNQLRSFFVKQSPDTESVQPGGSVTLQCSLLSKNKENGDQCPGEHSVHWFRSGSGESHPGFIHTHNDTEGRSCDYSLSKTIKSSSDAGTYYCAVAACGEILFVEGTKVDTKQELWTSLIVLGTLLACCVIVIAALIISRNQKPVCKHCKGEATNHAQDDRSAEDQPSNADGEEGAVNYVALDFPLRSAKRWKNNRELTQECVYSGRRDPQ